MQKGPNLPEQTDYASQCNDFFKQIHCIVTAAEEWRSPEYPQGRGGLIPFAWKGWTRGGPGFAPSDRRDKPCRWNGFWGIRTDIARKMMQILDSGNWKSRAP